MRLSDIIQDSDILASDTQQSSEELKGKYDVVKTVLKQIYTLPSRTNILRF